MKKYFAIDLDDFVEDVHGEMASVQDGGAGHYCRINADSPDEATEILLDRLRSFVCGKFYESDAYGLKKSDED